MGADTLSRRLEGCRVLVVEDAQEIREIFGNYLIGAGASVDFAEDGRRGFEVAVSAPFDAIVMDLQMPVMDGYEACRRLRQNGFSGIILAVSADPRAELVADWLALGFDGYLRKPLEASLLVNSVVGFTRRGGTPAALVELGERRPAIDASVFRYSPKVRAIIAKFAGELTARFRELRSAIEASDSERVLALAHKLRGSAGNCGFRGLALAVTRLEDRVREGASAEALASELANLEAIGHKTEREWNEHAMKECECQRM